MNAIISQNDLMYYSKDEYIKLRKFNDIINYNLEMVNETKTDYDYYILENSKEILYQYKNYFIDIINQRLNDNNEKNEILKIEFNDLKIEFNNNKNNTEYLKSLLEKMRINKNKDIELLNERQELNKILINQISQIENIIIDIYNLIKSRKV
jgi:hypothetical protein